MEGHENFISLSAKFSLEQQHEKDFAPACLAFKRPAFVLQPGYFVKLFL